MKKFTHVLALVIAMTLCIGAMTACSGGSDKDEQSTTTAPSGSTKPGASKPDTSKPDTSKPDTTKPGATKPEDNTTTAPDTDGDKVPEGDNNATEGENTEDKTPGDSSTEGENAKDEETKDESTSK